MLTIRSVDRSGHFILEYTLSKLAYLDHSQQNMFVCGGFNLDPSTIKKIELFFSANVDGMAL
ncbi:hypothetical protein MHI37_04710 [Paenibacillus sp. FSL H8-0548]|uniref:hypothetical protein n=1 Tax=Paenibacillus sp. FSL H8-0548 TaxID=1920422 RepID=UPI00118019B9|nr:hypothetical protein [Paenibacillus sp. FSL H8-0548]